MLTTGYTAAGGSQTLILAVIDGVSRGIEIETWVQSKEQ